MPSCMSGRCGASRCDTCAASNQPTIKVTRKKEVVRTEWMTENLPITLTSECGGDFFAIRVDGKKVASIQMDTDGTQIQFRPSVVVLPNKIHKFDGRGGFGVTL